MIDRRVCPSTAGPLSCTPDASGPAVVKRVRHRADQRLRLARIARRVAARDVAGYAAHGTASRSGHDRELASGLGTARIV